MKAKLQTSNSTIETEHIDYRRGILRGDGLSVILFALSINPASFLMQKLEGYEIGDVNRKKEPINHLLSVDDLKLYTKTLTQMMKLLVFVTTLTNDIGMIFGESKYAYIC